MARLIKRHFSQGLSLTLFFGLPSLSQAHAKIGARTRWNLIEELLTQLVRHDVPLIVHATSYKLDRISRNYPRYNLFAAKIRLRFVEWKFDSTE